MRTLKFISLTMLILSMFIDALSQVNSVHIEANSTRGSNQVLIGASAGMFATSAADNVMLGGAAGYFTTGNRNTFLGFSAGYKTTSGVDNVFIGYRSGRENHGGNKNIYIGYYAGYANIWGNQNVAIGDQAGYSTTGSNNLFLGYHAGRSETGSNKLYIANSSTSTPLIYGEFDNNRLTVHGNLGIGTTTPTEKLDVRGRIISNANNPFIQFKHNETNIGILGSDGAIYGGTASNLGLYVYGNNSLEFSTNNSRRMVIAGNGKVGISTTSPAAWLHINSGPNTDAAVLATSTENNKLIVSSGVTSPAYVSTFKITHEFGSNRNNGYINFHRGGSYDGGFLTFGSSGIERLRINSDGNIGIGIEIPQYKLDVCGTIRAREVKIDLGGVCIVPDYVFKDGYPLMDLRELEQFVQTNHHLPEIPSEKEMHENGVNMMELQMKLLQKIEELTLYTIQQEEKIRVLEERMGTLVLSE